MIDLLWLVLRGASLVLVLEAAGAALFLVAFARFLGVSAPVIRRAAFHVTIAALAVLLAQALLEPAHLGGELAAIGDADLERLAIFSANGAALAVRIAGVSGLALGLARGGVALGPAGGLAAVSSYLLEGHTTLARERWLLAPLLLIHILILTFWFGALWPLRQLLVLEPEGVAARVLAAFSAAALWLVPVIPCAGGALAFLLLPNLAALWTPYGLMLIGKVALFTALMAVAALNKLAFTPALARGERAAVPRLRRSVAVEFVLICAALVLTAVMTGLFSPAGGEDVAAVARILTVRA